MRVSYGGFSVREVIERSFPRATSKLPSGWTTPFLTNPNVTEEWVRNALVLLPDHPLLHIALAGFETDSKRADFLRSFGLARLPKNSIICTRAGEMLLAQDRPKLALAAVDKALLVDPADLAAQRLRLRSPGRQCPDDKHTENAWEEFDSLCQIIK